MQISICFILINDHNIYCVELCNVLLMKIALKWHEYILIITDSCSIAYTGH